MSRNKIKTASPVSTEPTLKYLTGQWRSARPWFEEKIPPCDNGCPAGEKIRDWLNFIKQGKIKDAWEIVMNDNPLMAITGRVCPHPCETECNRGSFDEALNIHSLETLIGDEGIKNKWGKIPVINAGGPRAAIIGSGPAGLTCAYFLLKAGIPVTVFEALPVIGGMLRVGIPDHRLPKEILNGILASPVFERIKFSANTKVGKDISFEAIQKTFSAVFIATGAHINRKLNIQGEDNPRVLSGIEFLKMVNTGEKISLGQKVVVIGGGNTAIDVARCARRMGSDITVVYRKTENHMRAFPEEIEACKKEEIKFQFQNQPTDIINTGSTLKALFYSVEDWIYDVLECDNVITAIGQIPDLSFLPQALKDLAGNKQYDALETDGIFIGGDAVNPRWVTDAVGAGKAAAERIAAYMGKRQPQKEQIQKPNIARPEELNTDYFAHLKRLQNPKTMREAAKEAERCFYCGKCDKCGICWAFCPENAIKFGDERFRIDYDYCKGCSICVKECPRNALSLQGEEK